MRCGGRRWAERRGHMGRAAGFAAESHGDDPAWRAGIRRSPAPGPRFFGLSKSPPLRHI